MSSFVKDAERHAKFYAIVAAATTLDIAIADLVKAQKHYDEDKSLGYDLDAQLAADLEVARHESRYCEIKFNMESQGIAYEAIVHVQQYSTSPFVEAGETVQSIARRILPRWAAIYIHNHRPSNPTKGAMMAKLRRALALVICVVIEKYHSDTPKGGMFRGASDIEDEIFSLLRDSDSNLPEVWHNAVQ